ncbi:MAG: undecaprenyl-diphosphate phosphatase [Anaplasmataceae bacterium]|nr:undecaprenyl-diphosphate phosphatase [Anaplasmataceae bacterium]
MILEGLIIKTIIGFLPVILTAIFQAIIEFLPISSTAHVLLLNNILQINIDDLKSIFMAANLGTACVMAIYYKKQIFNIKTIINISLATLPLILIAPFLINIISTKLNNNLVIGISLIIVGVIMIFIKKLKYKIDNKITLGKSLIIGLCQTVALIPGVSRSGITIICGKLCKFSTSNAVDFSFILAIPTLSIVSLHQLIIVDKLNIGINVIISFIVSFIISFLVIDKIILFIKKYGLTPFGYYRITIGIILIILFYS